ncbi:hypothetical protein CCR75_000676 [Bremia lactucae]|uniref:Ribosome biogenesis protein NOP53 n=1 Tax=Bremia lactucae TaxID=4779 RepID=A0A976FEL8_BRELC|nr:hypothetical protein CCR75_000676 [Bremia lactucae]
MLGWAIGWHSRISNMAGKRRRQQRAKEIGELVEESIRREAEDKKLQHVEAEKLFQIDNKGGAPAPLTKKQKLERMQKDPLLASSRKFNAAKAHKSELLAVKKLQEKVVQLQQQDKLNKSQKVEDLWGHDGNVKDDKQNELLDDYVAPVVKKKIMRRKLVASTKYAVATVEVAAAGQSYHPDFDSHQDIVAEAVANELEKQEKKAQLQKPLANGMSEETLQYIKQVSDEESSDTEDDELDRKPRKCPATVTRAQRNKRSRHKQMEVKHHMRRGEKSIIKQINASNHILHDILKSEKEAAKKQELKKILLEQKLQDPPLVRVAGKYTKLERETPVSFSEELTGSMRTLKPKGHPLLDRFDSLHKRNLIQIGRPKKTRKAKVRIIEV